MAGKRAPRAAAPEKAALAKLAELASRGVAPDRVRREVESIVTTWRESATAYEDRAELRERLEEMRDQLAEGVEAAAEAVEEMDQDEKAAVTASRKALSALTAGRDALSAAHASIRL
ncbi:hypothetical protein [Roseomonas elaeocarpi]|uniref:KfrA N-terminal DNA-binding domain-containing protein n=1 Tax=Roseomonas elaeocarpi TaxID=907779 RepID=A0ABV6JQJ1_9PROT